MLIKVIEILLLSSFAGLSIFLWKIATPARILAFLSRFQQFEYFSLLVKTTKMFLLAIFVALLTLLLTLAQGIAIYGDSTSATCMNCEAEGELFRRALLPILFSITFMFFLKIRKIREKFWSIAFALLIMIYWIVAINKPMFEDRIAAWSTFSESELWYNVLLVSFLPVFICGMLYYFTFRTLLSRS